MEPLIPIEMHKKENTKKTGICRERERDSYVLIERKR